MKHCDFKIITFCDDKREEYSFDGLCSDENGVVRFTYRDGASSVELRLSDICEMNRTGEYGMQMRFVAGERTECRLSFGGSFGTVCVTTKAYTLQQEEDAIRVFLDYTLDFPHDVQHMRLFITAKFKN